MFHVWTLLSLALCVSVVPRVTALPACDSEIWCHGQLLEAVQTKGLYEDSKTFVDMSLKDDPDIIISAYKALAANYSQSTGPPKSQIREFISRYFNEPDREFEKWTPTDWNGNPKFLRNIKDEDLRHFGKALCEKWSKLGRKIKREVKDSEDRYSLLYLDKPFIVPGGRFRETYYWDSYWVIKGLLACEMTTTVKGMLENFISLVQRYGMVPNGNRKYYTRRSQPPFLTPMVDLYMEATNDITFLRQILPDLNTEYEFWENNRSIECCPGRPEKIPANRYAAPITMPRPESYSEDRRTQQQSNASEETMYQNLASGAESGWDFSSRWFSQNFQKVTSLHQKWLPFTETTNVIPVDLNSILCWNERLLAKFYDITGQKHMSQLFTARHHSRVTNVSKLFWDDAEGVWFDITLSTNTRRAQFFPSNVFPMYTGCFEQNDTQVGRKVLRYLQHVNVLNYTSGVPTSLLETGQQWDYPNAWPPLQDVVVTAILTANQPESKRLALKIANRWVTSNYIGWKRTNGNMFEKYVVTENGSRGSGGEYNVQEGFGWTNGVILDFLARFGEDLSVDYSPTSGAAAKLTKEPLNVYTIILSVSLTILVYPKW